MLDVNLQEMNDWAVALEAKNGVARENARRHLVEMGPVATPLLESLLKDRRQQVRWEAAMALKEIADPASVPALIDALEDEDQDVRWVVAEALAAVGVPSLKPLLQQLVLRADSLEVREGVRLVLSRIEDDEVLHVFDPVYEALENSLPTEMVILAAGKVMGT